MLENSSSNRNLQPQKEKSNHMYAHGGPLLVRSCDVVAFYISIDRIKPKNKNDFQPW